MTYKRLGKFPAAEQAYLKCLKIREGLLERTHPDYIAINHNLGELYLAIGNQEKASEYFATSLQIIKEIEEAEKLK